MPEITIGLAHDAERYLASDFLVWFHEPTTMSTDELLEGLPTDQRFAAEVPGSDPGTYPGIYGVFPLTLTVPGPGEAGVVVPVAGLTWVGVHPDHRRQGILTAMMRDHLVRTRDAGLALSILHASEPLIYGRHGYGLASLEHEVTLSQGTTLTAPGLDTQAASITVHLTTVAAPGIADRLHQIDTALAPSQPGMVIWAPSLYASAFRDEPSDLRGSEPLRALIARRDGTDVGYVLLRRTPSWTKGRPDGTVAARHLHGDVVTRLALLRRLVGLDLTGSIELAQVGIDDPLLTWLPGPRGASAVETYDNLWVRLVDVPAALQLRSYSADLDLVLDVTDDAAPWNAGRWRFVGRDGQATVTRTDDEPDVSLPVEVLGAAYLGGRNLLTMGDAGVLTEHRAGAVAQLWRAMRTDRPPVAAVGF